MPTLNRVQLIGRLGKDPESRYTPTGKQVTHFSLAVSNRWKAEGETKEYTEWAREPIVDALDAQRLSDLAQAQALPPAWEDERARVLVRPDAPWCRRVIGCLANELARTRPQQAQAVLRTRPSGGFSVSVRAPRATPFGASQLCEAFGGSGRAAAGGIEALPAQDVDRFIQALAAARWGRAT